MTDFNPANLTVCYLPLTTRKNPIAGRKYTLTHSDKTGELFLSVGSRYNLSAINMIMRDEVLIKLIQQKGRYILMGQVYISGGEFGEKQSEVRFVIFQKELKLALTALFYGDRDFYFYHSKLLDTPIYIQFKSVYPKLHQLKYFGTPRQYLTLRSDRTKV